MKPSPRPRGYVTKFGYRRVKAPGERRLKMEHVLVWERHHGPISPGMELHHLNGDKLDNRIENLRLVTRLEHKRIHGGCELRDGVWWKRCRECGVLKAVTDFYQYPGRNGVMGICKPCSSRLAVKYKRRRRQRARLRALVMVTIGLGMLPPMVEPESSTVTESAPIPSGTGASCEEVTA